jgi:DNA gyrase subunit A
MPVVDTIALHETAQTRYLNYALSVITSRALPDLRDGLKPVQRRILYAMFTNLRLLPEGRFRKSATVVGEVMGKYHPHGDSAIYEAMVRMAQDFSLRAPLVDGHGNFGSLDGDNPAAMRYTEAKLRPLAVELLAELRKQTVAFRPTFDGTLSEPVVLPARFPNLLVNGASGIAVGMATNIPPHNLAEVVDACIRLVDSPNARLDTLLQHVQGPDFPTGGRILNTPDEIAAIYASGEGAVEVRGEYEREGKNLILTSVPYGMSKADLIEKIAVHIAEEKVPQLVDIRDESTDQVRIVLELKRGASAEAAMAYLFKHTPLQSRFHVNLTCLVPTANPQISAPQRVDLLTLLRGFLDFRMEVVVRRTQHDLEQLERRIHILRGLEIIFDALDECIKIIRASKNKGDAAGRLMHRFRIDEEQTDAILELKLYRLAQLEINLIRAELEEKEGSAASLRELLSDEGARWKLVKKELREVKAAYGEPRRTEIAGPDPGLTFSEEDYIVAEDVHVIVTRDGWVKRQRSYTTVDAIRVREGDTVGWVLPASTRATVAFVTTAGRVYSVRTEALPSTTGHGSPIQKLFDFADREQIVGVVSLDERILPAALPDPDAPAELFSGDGAPPTAGPFLLAVTRGGQTTRMEASAFAEPSNKNGRLLMKLPAKDALAFADVSAGDENVCLATREGAALIFPSAQIPVVKGPGKGVIAIRLDKGDHVIGAALSTAARDGLDVQTSRGRDETIRTTKFEVTGRGGKGKRVIKLGTLSLAEQPPVVRSFED